MYHILALFHCKYVWKGLISYQGCISCCKLCQSCDVHICNIIRYNLYLSVAIAKCPQKVAHLTHSIHATCKVLPQSIVAALEGSIAWTNCTMVSSFYMENMHKCSSPIDWPMSRSTIEASIKYSTVLLISSQIEWRHLTDVTVDACMDFTCYLSICKFWILLWAEDDGHAVLSLSHNPVSFPYERGLHFLYYLLFFSTLCASGMLIPLTSHQPADFRFWWKKGPYRYSHLEKAHTSQTKCFQSDICFGW